MSTKSKKRQQPHSERIHVAMQPHLHRRIAAAADEKGMHKSAYARQAMREKLTRDQAPK
jgi:predicted HicB family RNase H-like nuclease